MGKKHNIGTAIDLEMIDSSDIKKTSSEISNKRCDMLSNNSDEGNMTITNEEHDVLRDNWDEGSITIINERNDILQDKSDEGNASIMQDFE